MSVSVNGANGNYGTISSIPKEIFSLFVLAGTLNPSLDSKSISSDSL